MESLLITNLLKLLFYVATFISTLHLAMIGYHWYSYTSERTLANIVVISYFLIVSAALATIASIAFL